MLILPMPTPEQMKLAQEQGTEGLEEVEMSL